MKKVHGTRRAVPGVPVPLRWRAASGRWTSAWSGSVFPGLRVSRWISISTSAAKPSSASRCEARSNVISAYASSFCAVCPSPTRSAPGVLCLEYSRHYPDMSATASSSGDAPVSVTHAGRQYFDAVLGVQSMNSLTGARRSCFRAYCVISFMPLVPASMVLMTLLQATHLTARGAIIPGSEKSGNDMTTTHPTPLKSCRRQSLTPTLFSQFLRLWFR